VKRTTLILTLIVTCLAATWMPLLSSAQTVQQAHAVAVPTEFGYGFSQISADGSHAYQLGFNWIQSYYPPTAPQPTRVLYRVQVRAADLSDPLAFRSRLTALAQQYGSYIDAYEIGNEVNLASEWGAPPVAADYVLLLSQAQAVLRAVDPGATIVSAGLATVGRVSSTWYGHLGHNGSVQDEREYLKEFIDNHGHEMADAIGYHPMGFRADYSAAPDTSGGTSETNCSNGLCFRSVEKIYEILRAKGVTNPRIWATEVGWIVTPPVGCQTDPSWNGRTWQAVSPEKQAENLVGAFWYARSHWPWMEAMFVFNLDINYIPYYSACEQMSYYSVSGRPAEVSLGAMSKSIHWIFLPMTLR
jgi:hypothetical protein